MAFTGVMNYSPNVDAVLWFAERIWPRLRWQAPELCFEIVGRDPDPRVLRWGGGLG
jgi:polysaccharide biosynthesis protein PslH